MNDITNGKMSKPLWAWVDEISPCIFQSSKHKGPKQKESAVKTKNQSP